MAHFFEANPVQAGRLAVRLAELARELPGDKAAFALSEAARVASWANSWKSALPIAEEAETLLLFEDMEAVARTWLNIADVNYEGGAFQKALIFYDRCFDCINQSGALHVWPRAATNKVALLVDMGRFDEAQRLAHQIITNWTEGDQEQTLSSTYSNLALMKHALGDFDTARKYAELSLSHGSDLPFHRSVVKSILGIVALETGRLNEASEFAREIVEEVESAHGRFGDFSYIEVFLARWRTRCGSMAEAADRLEKAINEGKDRDFGGWLRMRLEHAQLVKKANPRLAKDLAEDIRTKAARASAAPLEHAAASLIIRIQ